MTITITSAESFAGKGNHSGLTRTPHESSQGLVQQGLKMREVGFMMGIEIEEIPRF
jgi:hypothetical protein